MTAEAVDDAAEPVGPELVVRKPPRWAVGPFRPITCLLANADLTWQLSKREVQGRYRGSAFGIFWASFNPILMLVVFTFVFGFVFEMRWEHATEGNRTQFALILFAGLLLYWLYSECLARAPTLIRQNVNYVKKVSFPLEVLPWTLLAGGLFHALISVLVLLGVSWAAVGPPPWTAVLFPVVLFPFLLVILGLTWFVASLSVYLPDFEPVMNVFLLAAMFLSPIFYPASSLPQDYVAYFYLNPLMLVVEQSREVLIFGELPDWQKLGIHLGVGWLVAWLGLWSFQRMRGGFADVL